MSYKEGMVRSFVGISVQMDCGILPTMNVNESPRVSSLG